MVPRSSVILVEGIPPMHAPAIKCFRKVVLQVGTPTQNDNAGPVEMAQSTMKKLSSAVQLSHVHIAYLYLDGDTLAEARDLHACVQSLSSTVNVTMGWADLSSIGREGWNILDRDTEKAVET
ncbi:hypothetical protein LTR95_018289 [Oleoguttula sp. CCFEE 5521]